MEIDEGPSRDESAETDEKDADEIRGPKITVFSAISVVIAVMLVVAAIAATVQLIRTTSVSAQIHERYNECTSAASELMVASDFLTTECRMFVVTGDRRFMDGYFEELLGTKRRDAAVATLSAEAGDERATAELRTALGESNELAAFELYAMKLVCEAETIEPQPDPIVQVTLKREDALLSATEKRALAESMVLGEKYREMKAAITKDADDCAAELVRGLEERILANERSTDGLLVALVVIVIALMALVAAIAVSNFVLLTRPMQVHERNLREGKPFDVVGCFEIRRVAVSYNKLLDKVNRRTAYLQHEAETDALTGALNRGSYDRLLENQQGNYALILIDVDHFKEVNDRYGHEVGDEVLKLVASTIMNKFRSSDFVCRIGGDEFAVIVTSVTREQRFVIEEKIAAIADDIAHSEDGLPKITLSLGVAFNDEASSGNLYHDADKALYKSKHAGRDQVTFFGE